MSGKHEVAEKREDTWWNLDYAGFDDGIDWENHRFVCVFYLNVPDWSFGEEMTCGYESIDDAKKGIEDSVSPDEHGNTWRPDALIDLDDNVVYDVSVKTEVEFSRKAE